MKILLLQLSDIHFWSNRRNPLNHPDRVQELANAVQGVEAGIEACFIAFTGDVAQGAQPQEYEMAHHFFDAFTNALQTTRPEWHLESLFIAGNHDCDLPEDDDVRQTLIQAIFKDIRSPYRPKIGLIEHCLEAQNEFWNFEAHRKGRETPLTGTKRLFQAHEFNLAGRSIVFHCYNTAWLSQRNEQPGQLLMPIDLVPDAPDCDLLVSLLHHPFNWIQPDNSKAFRNLIEYQSDFILTGHEHAADGAVKRTLEGAVVNVSEGAVLQEHGTFRSGFIAHVVNFDSSESRTAVYERSTNPSRYSAKRQTDWQPLERNPMRCAARLNNSVEFLSILHDVGANFLHPYKDKLELDDLFIYPDFERSTPVDRSHSAGDLESQVVSMLAGDKVVSCVREEKEMFFSGPDRCGKTALCKKLYVDLQGLGFTPVLLNGSELSSTDAKVFSGTLNRAVQQQYGSRGLERYANIHQAQKVVLVDDFHKASAGNWERNRGDMLNIKGQNRVIELMRQHFGKIVIMASDILRFEDFAREDGEASLLMKFEGCEFRELGHRLRHKFIEKWQMLGREHSGDERDSSHHIREVENLVTTLLGKNLIPSYPIFLFTILQQQEANRTPTTGSGAYGYYYQALVTAALERALSTLHATNKTVTRHLPMDILQVVLPFLAFRMFEMDKNSLSDEEFEDLAREYQERHQVRFNPEHLKTILEDAHMLARDIEGRYRFRYAYIGYYFVANYIGANLHTSTRGAEMRALLSHMTARLHIEDYSNILTFFMYFTRDEQTIQEIVTLARSLFSEYSPSKLEEDVAFVKRLNGQTPPLRLGEGSVHQHQEEQRRERDDVERAKRPDQHADEDDEAARWRGWQQEAQKRETDKQADLVAEKRALSLAQQFNLAAKTVQLMGQILRNSPGALESGPKLDIASECELLGLRSLHALFDIIEGELENFRGLFSELLLNGQLKEPQTYAEEQEFARRVDNFLTNTLINTAYVYVRRIAHAVGSEHLKETYKAIDKSLSPVAIDLIHTSVKLDHFRDFPTEEVLALESELEKNPFARFILRLMVRDHFYIFPAASPAIRQRICARLGISTSDPKALTMGQKKLN